MLNKEVYQIGDKVYYFQPTGVGKPFNMIPAEVVKVAYPSAKVKGSFLNGDKTVWVSMRKLQMQESE